MFACLVAVHGPDTYIFTVISPFFNGVVSVLLHNLNWQSSLNIGIICFMSALFCELDSMQQMASWNQMFPKRAKVTGLL